METCVILAAGNSIRMGKPKPLLRFNEKQNFLERIVSVYGSAGIKEIVVVTNAEVLDRIRVSVSPSFKESRFVLNSQPELGRFYSIKLGIELVKKNTMVFLQNIDNPFITQEIIADLKNQIGTSDYAVPEFEGRPGHPVLLSKKMVDALSAQENYDVNFRDFLKLYRGKTVPANDPGIMVNINTPEDYSKHFPNMKG